MEKLFFLFSSLLLTSASLAYYNPYPYETYTQVYPESYGKEGIFENFPLRPVIYEMDITANISNRFARTLVVSKVKNEGNVSKETTFTVVLHEKAFITGFIMEVGGKSYNAYITEKQEAKEIYNEAVATGLSAGHVAVSSRDSNKFTVSVNLEANSKITFLLTYEELLERKNDQYELVININPGQIVEYLNVKVQINESRPLKFVRTPPLRSGNEISKNFDVDPSANIQINSSTAVVKFNPDSEQQRVFARALRSEEYNGLVGQFVVQYDVERDPTGGEILLQDGYFVHFFAPSDLTPLPKHLIFVLDSSGSMSQTNNKLEQLKDAINSILDDLREGDIISIVDFGSRIYVWDLNKENRSAVQFHYAETYQDPFSNLKKQKLPDAIQINHDTLPKLKRVLLDLQAYGGTNIIGGLVTALYLAKEAQSSYLQKLPEKRFQPMIIVVTDGQPNIGISSTEEIVNLVTRLNAENNNVPIFSLSLGSDADEDFLRKLSGKNSGFSRSIYEEADVSLQLEEFYNEISSPLLSNVTFKYSNDTKDVTKSKFPLYFKGTEFVIAGRCGNIDNEFPFGPPFISGEGPLYYTRYTPSKPIESRPVSSLERLWAYLTVKQSLEESLLTHDNWELKIKAFSIAIKYSFVTNVTSLVVVKPNKNITVDLENAYNGNFPNWRWRKYGGVPSAPVYPRPGFSYEGPPSFRPGFSYNAPSSPSYGLYSQQGAGVPPYTSYPASGFRVPQYQPLEDRVPPYQPSGFPAPPHIPYQPSGVPVQPHTPYQPSGVPVPPPPYQPGDRAPPYQPSGSPAPPHIPYQPSGVPVQPHTPYQPSGVPVPPPPYQPGVLVPPYTPYQPSASIIPSISQNSNGLTTTSTSTTIRQNLVVVLPWLALVLNSNGTITVDQRVYQLGDYNSPNLTTQQECPETPVNTTEKGNCSVLSRCPQVHSYLTDFSVYKRYFCEIPTNNEVYGGVCCPI